MRKEILYKDIIEEIESTGRNEIKRGQEKYRIQKQLLMIHVTGQLEDVQYWRVVVPDDLDVKFLLVDELHSVPYVAHPGVQWTIGKVRRYFWWKGMARDIREFIESLPDLPIGEDRPHNEKGKSPVPGHSRGQMARSKCRLHHGFASEQRWRGLHNDSSGSCHQDGALDPLQKDHNSRRGCKTLLAARGQTTRSPSGNPR